jgi:hypothetical protein
MSEPIPEYGGCLWPVDPACMTDDWDKLDPSVQSRALALASETLHRLTAYRVGGCPVTVRPCVRGGCWSSFIPFHGGSSFHPGLNTRGQWVNNSCGCQRRGCATSCEVNLEGPVGEIVEVLVDGDEVDPGDYMVQDDHLVWMGAGECLWPLTQDLSLAEGEGTFFVTYLNAYTVDSVGAHAAGMLAMEFAKACGMAGKCKLSKNVREVVRNGVSFTIEAGLFPGGVTGIEVVDAFIELWRPPGSPSRQSRVWSPDMAHR